MRMIWARRKASPQPRVDRLHFVMWDFLRMFLATALCGLAISLIAAAIALVLAHDAYAATLVHGPANAGKFDSDADTTDEFQPYPGMLLIGSGCGGEILDAVERDWKVTISGKNIDVRVMQTFIVPDGEATAATFNAMLPVGARLLRLSAHTAGSVWQGKVFDATSYVTLTAADIRNLSRRRMLVVQNDDGVISTDAIVNIGATEAIVVEYTYRIGAQETQDTRNFMVTLANGGYPFIDIAGKPAASGAVWVEWSGKKPARLVGMPSGATLETSGPRISGLSWTAHQLDTDARFQLAWEM